MNDNIKVLEDAVHTLQMDTSELLYKMTTMEGTIRSLQDENHEIKNRVVTKQFEYSELLHMAIDSEILFRLASNQSKRVYGDNTVENIISSMFMLCSSLYSVLDGHSNNEVYRVSIWAEFFERCFKELELSQNSEPDVYEVISKSVDRYIKQASYYFVSDVFDVYDRAPTLAWSLRDRYNYYQICTMLLSHERQDELRANILLSSLTPRYRKEYINYLFKNWDIDTIMVHWNSIQCLSCDVFRTAFDENMYLVLTNDSIHFRDGFEQKHWKFVERLRSHLPKINNYFKLRNS